MDELKVTKFSVVQGIFKQSDPDFVDGGYDLLGDSFGLIDQQGDRWGKFQRRIERLNEEAGDGTSYKVLWVARHGQGVHNVAEEKYGTPAWNRKWSLLEGDGELVWGPDPLLTEKGRDQVRKTRSAWESEIEDGIPLPEVLYSSPLRRAIDTAEITWNDLLPKVDRIIKENLREMIGLHTCDKRSTRSFLEESYPNYHLDPNFTEKDELWTPDHQEQPPQIAARARQFLDHLFETDKRTYISITGHGGIIGGLLGAVGHRAAVVETGSLIPLVIKATFSGANTEVKEDGRSDVAHGTSAEEAESAGTVMEGVVGSSGFTIESP